MELPESCRHYLSNYYLLERTREETHRFLEDIAVRVTAAVREHLKLNGDAYLTLENVYMQKDGGYVGFTFAVADAGVMGRMGKWMYEIVYRDAMRTDRLDDTTNCRVFGWTRKADARQSSEAKRVASMLGLPDPYRETLVSLTASPVDEIVDELAQLFVSYYDDYTRIIEAMSEELRLDTA